MRSKLVTWSSALAVALVVGACAEAPEPVGPDGGPLEPAAGGPDPLARWFAQASPAVLALGGTVFADHDEANHRLLFGVENANAIRGVTTALAHMGIPSSAYAVRVVEPIHMAATLRDSWRPTQGGIQIHFTSYLCTLGF